MAKILIIEDDSEVIENLSELLELKGYEVLTACNGKIGIELAMAELPDLVMSDIMMPETNGYDVLKALKSSPNTYAIPFIFLSAKAAHTDQRSGMELGADDYLVKPFENNEVIKAIEANLKKYNKIRKHYESNLNDLRSSIAKSLPHEFRTPLNSILGFTTFLKQSKDKLTPQDIDNMLSNIYDSGKRLQHLIENYNFYVSIMSLKSCKVEYDGQEMFTTDQIVTLARNYEREADIVENIEHFNAKITGKHFIKIIEELADNAIKFAEPNTKIEIKSVEKDGTVSYVFINRGRGFTKEQIKQIGAFVQFERNTFEQQGLGLGLAIVKKIATLYKGKFEIISEPGETTKVTVSFPIK